MVLSTALLCVYIYLTRHVQNSTRPQPLQLNKQSRSRQCRSTRNHLLGDRVNGFTGPTRSRLEPCPQCCAGGRPNGSRIMHCVWEESRKTRPRSSWMRARRDFFRSADGAQVNRFGPKALAPQARLGGAGPKNRHSPTELWVALLVCARCPAV